MKKYPRYLILMFLFLAAACEDVSVSVNSRGEIAFAREEGVFFLDADADSIELVDWTYGQEKTPALVRWSPDGNYLAYTNRVVDDYYDTDVYVIDRLGRGKRLVYSCRQVILQMEWSAEGSSLSVAQVGEDTDIGVADLALIDVATGESEIILRNVGDSVSWPIDSAFVFMQVKEANPDNSDILKGTLGLYDTESGEILEIVDAIIGKDGGIVADPDDYIAFSAIEVGDVEFSETMTTDAYAYSIRPHSEAVRLLERPVTFLKFSPDRSRLLMKAQREYSGYDLGYLEIESGEWNLLIEDVVDTVTVDSIDVAVQPAWHGKDAVLYWDIGRTYGHNGQGLRLMRYDLSDGMKRNFQPLIDRALDKILIATDGY